MASFLSSAAGQPSFTFTLAARRLAPDHPSRVNFWRTGAIWWVSASLPGHVASAARATNPPRVMHALWQRNILRGDDWIGQYGRVSSVAELAGVAG
jgi:hypothetical protein